MSDIEKIEQELLRVKENFAKYQEEFHKIEGLASAFESEAKRLEKENQLYRQFMMRAQELILSGDVDGMKRLFGGLDIKL